MTSLIGRRILVEEMCARYTMSTTLAALAAELGVALPPDPDADTRAALSPHFNIAPTQKAPIVVETKTGERRIGASRFGLVPHWAKDLKIGTRLLNARVETIAEKPAFRDALSRHRCLVVADGFFEWRREGKARIPFYFRLPGGRPFGMAGIWAVWHDPSRKPGEPDERVSSFSIVTCDAVGATAAIHERMPVVLPPEEYGPWLDRARTDPSEVLPILEAHVGAQLEGYEVSRAVNKVQNDDPSLIVPLK